MTLDDTSRDDLFIRWLRPDGYEPSAIKRNKGKITRCFPDVIILVQPYDILYWCIVEPVVAEGRSDQFSVFISPNGQEVNPGESGEYTITIYNQGSNPITVQIATAEGQEQECSQYSSSNTQVAGPIDAGSSGEASMNVTLTQSAEVLVTPQ